MSLSSQKISQFFSAEAKISFPNFLPLAPKIHFHLLSSLISLSYLFHLSHFSFSPKYWSWSPSVMLLIFLVNP
ncbi:hypothetical protein M6B38_112935 [Iris pallida]|uniref:Uncharacterized protein n=1 Tax=Iris pallida TaxID=29817 RepID=A0AAX6ILL7_IRIPA|nr:hypothetical protein M6B38_112935 [Iris pallida]